MHVLNSQKRFCVLAFTIFYFFFFKLSTMFLWLIYLPCCVYLDISATLSFPLTPCTGLQGTSCMCPQGPVGGVAGTHVQEQDTRITGGCTQTYRPRQILLQNGCAGIYAPSLSVFYGFKDMCINVQRKDQKDIYTTPVTLGTHTSGPGGRGWSEGTSSLAGHDLI